MVKLKLSDLFHKCAYDVEYEQAGSDVNYAFVEHSHTLYIYFQGSSSVTDWVRNFMFGKKPYKDMDVPYHVHRGFLAAWKEVEDIIISKVTEKVNRRKYNRKTKLYDFERVFKWKDIVIIGYSHGGALAAFCHECVWYHRPDLREDGLVGFGFEAPRIYAGFCVKKQLRERWSTFTVIRTNNDLVTHCPPRLFGYCHVGNMIKVKGDISLVESKWIPRCIKAHYPQVVYDALLKSETPKE